MVGRNGATLNLCNRFLYRGITEINYELSITNEVAQASADAWYDPFGVE